MKNHVRALRTAQGWSQGELGARLSVSRQTVNAIEAERYDPSLPLAFSIARLFARPIEEIFVEEGEGKVGGAVAAASDSSLPI